MTFEEWVEAYDPDDLIESREAYDAGYQEAWREIFAAKVEGTAAWEQSEVERVKRLKTLGGQ